MSREFVPIIEQARMGQIDEVKRISDNGETDINEVNNDGETAVLVACQRNDTPMVSILIEVGAKVKVEDDFGYSPLFWAKRNNNPELVQLIEESLKQQAP